MSIKRPSTWTWTRREAQRSFTYLLQATRIVGAGGSTGLCQYVEALSVKALRPRRHVHIQETETSLPPSLPPFTWLIGEPAASHLTAP